MSDFDFHNVNILRFHSAKLTQAAVDLFSSAALIMNGNEMALVKEVSE